MNNENPLADAARKPMIPSNTAGAGVTGSQRDGITLGGYVSKDLGKGHALDVEAGVGTKTGWGLSAFWRKVWK